MIPTADAKMSTSVPTFGERDHMASSWRFAPRWKEELLCTSPDAALVLELTMGELHVYFPTDEAWHRQAPSWAKDRRAEVLGELEQWCQAEGIPLTVDAQAWVAAPGSEASERDG